MSLLNIEALEATPLKDDPFEYVIVPNFVQPEALQRALADYPEIKTGGSHPLKSLEYGEGFDALIGALDGPEFETAISQKFDVELDGRPKMYTVRGMCRLKDGKIHTDSVTKIITVLLYLNDEWDDEGGRLRILRSGTDLEDFVEEAPPHSGTLLVFRRSDRSFHGHKPFEGKRRAIQMNWVTSSEAASRHGLRHKLSSIAKRLGLAK